MLTKSSKLTGFINPENRFFLNTIIQSVISAVASSYIFVFSWQYCCITLGLLWPYRLFLINIPEKFVNLHRFSSTIRLHISVYRTLLYEQSLLCVFQWSSDKSICAFYIQEAIYDRFFTGQWILCFVSQLNQCILCLLCTIIFLLNIYK